MKKRFNRRRKHEIANFYIIKLLQWEDETWNNQQSCFKIWTPQKYYWFHLEKMQQKIKEGKTDFDLSPKKKATNGRKSRNWSIVLEEMKKIPFNKRSTFRSLSFATNIPFF